VGRFVSPTPTPTLAPAFNGWVAYLYNNQLVVHHLADDRRRVIASVPVRELFWSPDRHSLTYIEQDTPFLYTPETDLKSQIPQPEKPGFRSTRVLGWSPDGRQVLFLGTWDHHEVLWRYEMDTNAAKIVAPARSGYAFWLDDHRLLQITSCGDGCRGVSIHDLTTGESRSLFPREAWATESATVGLALSPDRRYLLNARADGKLRRYDLHTGTADTLWVTPEGNTSWRVFLHYSTPWKVDDQRAAWSPQGRFIAFRQSLDNGLDSHLWQYRMGSTGRVATRYS